MARVISGKPGAEDAPLDTSLRPQRLDDFIGQVRVKDNVNIAMAAAFSPNPDNPPFFADFPFDLVDGELKRLDR